MARLHQPPFMSYPQVRQQAALLHRTLNQSGMPGALAHVLYRGAKRTRAYPRTYIEALLRHPSVPGRITPETVRQFNVSSDGREALSRSRAEWCWVLTTLASPSPVGQQLMLTTAQAGAVMGVSESTVNCWRREHPEIVRVEGDQSYINAVDFMGLFEWWRTT